MKNYLLKTASSPTSYYTSNDLTNFELAINSNIGGLSKNYKGKIYARGASSYYTSLKEYDRDGTLLNNVFDGVNGTGHIRYIGNLIFSPRDSKYHNIETHETKDMTYGASGNFFDICLYNNYYYVVGENGNIYRTNDLDASSWEKITISGITDSNFTIREHNGKLFLGCTKLYVVDIATLTLEKTYTFSSGYRLLDFECINDVYYLCAQMGYSSTKNMLFATYDLVNNDISNIGVYQMARSYDNGYPYPYVNYINYNPVDNKIIFTGNDYVSYMIYDISSTTVEKIELTPTYNNPICVYNEVELDIIGNNYTIASNGVKVENGYICNPENNLTLTIRADENYTLDEVTSTNGTVTIYDDYATVEYSDAYTEDTLYISTLYDLKAEIGNYQLDTTLTIENDFETIEFENVAFTFYNQGLYPVKSIKTMNDGKMYYEILDDLVLVYDNGWLDNDYSYIIINEEFSVNNELYNIFNRAVKYDYFFKGVVINDNIDEGVSQIWREENHNVKSFYIAHDYYADLDTTYRVYLFKNDSSYFDRIYEVKDGYKIDTFTSTAGEVIDNKVRFYASDLSQNLEINVDIITIGNDFTIVLYNYKDEMSIINKKLTNGLSVIGNLVEDCSMISPSIVFELTKAPSYNYCYIPEFKRYYFIKDIINVGFNLWRVNLNIDVLKSYTADIQASRGMILRSSSVYNEYIFDKNAPLESKYTVNEVEVNNIDAYHGFETDTDKDFCTVITLTKIKATVLQGTIVNNNVPNYAVARNILPRVNVSNINISEGSVGDDFTMSFIVKNKDTAYWIMNRLNTRGLSSFIVSAYDLPMPIYANNVAQICEVGGWFVSSIVFNKTEDTTYTQSFNDGEVLAISGAPQYYPLAQFEIDDYITLKNNYLDYNATYEIYIPYFGWKDFTATELIGNTIEIGYIIDIVTGKNSCYVIDTTNNKLLFTSQTQLGIALMTSFSDIKDISDRADYIQRNMGLDILKSGITTTPNMITSTIAFTNAIQVGFESLISLDNLRQKAVVNLPNGNISLYQPKKIRIRVTAPNNIISDDYIERCGKPLNEFRRVFEIWSTFYSGTLDICFMQVDDLDIKINGTDTELDMIKALLKMGAYWTK